MIINSNGYFEQYYESVMSGERVCGNDLKQCLERVNKFIHHENYIYDTEEADKRIRFLERWYRGTKEPYYNKPIEVMLWQKAFISAVYGTYRLDGRRQFQFVVLEVARKNGKTTLSSGLCLYEFFIGAPGQLISIASNDEATAQLCLDDIEINREIKDPRNKVSTKTRKNNKAVIINKVNHTEVSMLTDKMKSKDGRNADIVIHDEAHELKNDKLEKACLQSQSSKDNPLYLLITTEGIVRDGYTDALFEKARKQLYEDDLLEIEPDHLYWLYTQDSELEIFQDEQSWTKSNPALEYGVKKIEKLRSMINSARIYPKDREMVLTKDFNWKVVNGVNWLSASLFASMENLQSDSFKNSYCFAGTDLAHTTDLVSLQLVFERDKKKHSIGHYWITKQKLERDNDAKAGAQYEQWKKDGYITVVDETSVSVSLVADYIYGLSKSHGIRVLMCGYDDKFANEFRDRCKMYGIQTDIVGQYGSVVGDDISRIEADLNAGKLFIGDPVTRWCLLNARLKTTSTGTILQKPVDNKSAKIDGADALVDAYEMMKRHGEKYAKYLG